MSVRFGSLFSGIGGFDLGLERAGMECAWQVEIDPKAREVLRRHWPTVPRHEDVTKIGGDTLGAVDLICGGFPCQDLSVAGRRAGLAGERSGLFYQFMRIVGEIAPRWVLIENVPGLLSSNGGRDMGAVLGALGQLGYGYAWRVLDSQFFGVPQRRRRVFIVGCAGGVCPPEVLFEPESLPGGPPPSRETGEGVAASVIKGAAIGRKPEAGPQWGEHLDDGSCYTLNCAETHAVVATAFNWQSAGDCRQNPQEERTDSLHVGQVPAVAFAVNQRREGRLSEVHGSLHEPSGTQVDGVLAPEAIRLGRDRIAGWVDREDRAFAFQDDRRRSTAQEHIYHKPAGRADALTAQKQHVLAAIPRRLTPRECERLQAFPDDWTRHDSGGQEIADSPRYRMLGNAVTVSVAEWIGRRILEATR